MDRFILWMTLVAALGSGLMGGFFFAFSNLVMAALGRIPVPAGISAMQSINVVVLNPLFFLGFFGTALLSLVLAVLAVVRFGSPGMIFVLAGSLLYLVCIIVVTIAANVPMNEALAKVDPESATGASMWSDYLVRWTQWNHARTVGGLAACGSFMLALRSMG